MARKLIKMGYHYVGTTYDSDFIYDIYENDKGSTKLVPIQCR